MRDVHNWLVADDALARHVERTVRSTVRSGIDSLRIDCLLGRIELYGRTRGRLQRATAMLAARHIAGMVNVASSLTVPAPAEQVAVA